MGRNFSNLVEELTSRGDAETNIPEIYRRWAAISCVAGALGKRVWYSFGEFVVWPNLYICLVGGPGSGKSLSLRLPYKVFKRLASVIGKPEEENHTQEWELAGMTRPLFCLTNKATAEQIVVIMHHLAGIEYALDTLGSEEPIKTAPLTVVTSEFGSLMTNKRESIQFLLTDMWDANDEYSDQTKTSGQFFVPHPCLNWVAGATPQQFIKHMPDDAGDQGLLSRLIVVNYDGAPMTQDLMFATHSDSRIDRLVEDLAEVAKMGGEMRFESPELLDQARKEVREGLLPRPNHPVMEAGYNNRRPAHIIKVAMVLSASRGASYKISRDDWENAKRFVLEAEKSMPQIFDMFNSTEVGRTAHDLAKYVTISKRMALREFKQMLLNRVKSASEAKSMLQQLLEAGYIDILDDKWVIPGKGGK